jgi:hypothetical protein
MTWVPRSSDKRSTQTNPQRLTQTHPKRSTQSIARRKKEKRQQRTLLYLAFSIGTSIILNIALVMTALEWYGTEAAIATLVSSVLGHLFSRSQEHSLAFLKKLEFVNRSCSASYKLY